MIKHYGPKLLTLLVTLLLLPACNTIRPKGCYAKNGRKEVVCASYATSGNTGAASVAAASSSAH
jgi:threonine synthase